MYRSVTIQQNSRLLSNPSIISPKPIRKITSLPINKLNSPRSFPTKTPALTYFLNQRREYGLFDNFKRIFKQELDKNKDLKESIEDLKKQKDAIVDSEIAKTVKKPVDQTKEILQKVKTSVSEYNVGEKALKGFENISDKINTASDFLKETSSKVPGFGKKEKTDTQKKGQKDDNVDNAEQAQPDAENVQKTVEETSPNETEKTEAAAEPHPSEPMSEYAKQETRQEEPSEKVVDIVPMAVPKKGWFNFSPKLAKTVDQIRLYIPNFSIVEFLQQANDVHRDFLIALNTKNSELLTEVTTDPLAERLTALWVKGEEDVDQCHVIENFDAELEDCDPEKPSIRLGFEAHLVLIRPDGTVLPITLPRGDTSSVVQVKGAFEWTFEEGDALINDFMCYHMDTIY